MSQATPLPAEAAELLRAWQHDPQVNTYLNAADWKSAFATYPYLQVDSPPPFVRLHKPLREATIAAITSAGIYVEGEQARFDAAHPLGDTSLRLVPAETPYERLSLAHDHYDHTVPKQDMNTVNPIRNLQALQAEGTLGGVHPTLISTHGYMPLWDELFENLVPPVLDHLRANNVDAVLLAPVCPICHQSISLLAREIEGIGIPTVTVLTLRASAKRIALPRALFTGFPRGQTLGKPNEPTLQREILRQALTLLETAEAPAFYDRYDDQLQAPG